jgi:hypothetical protein
MNPGGEFSITQPGGIRIAVDRRRTSNSDGGPAGTAAARSGVVGSSQPNVKVGGDPRPAGA